MSEVKGKIYKLINDLNDKIYIGSSTYQYLSTRLRCHKNSSKNETGRRDSKLYKYIREKGIEHFQIELIEEYTCETKQQLCEREQYWIEQLKPELNMFRAIANPNYEQECRDKNERCERSKAFYHSHKEEILKQNKLYREKNKDEISKRRKKYRDENKEEIFKPITCDCGCIVSKKSMSRHLKSPKHATLLANK
jgi:group I intron endonuclease